MEGYFFFYLFGHGIFIFFTFSKTSENILATVFSGFEKRKKTFSAKKRDIFEIGSVRVNY